MRGTEMRNAVGFNPGQSLLKGLRGTSGYGQAMAAASQMNLEADKANKGHQLKQMESDTQQRQAAARNNAQQQQAAIGRKTQANQINHKKRMSDMNNRMGYQQLNKKKGLEKKQTVLNYLARDL